MNIDLGNITVRFLPLANFYTLFGDESLLLFLRALSQNGSLSRAASYLGISKSTALHKARKLRRLGFIGEDLSPSAHLFLPFVNTGDAIQLLRRPLLLLVEGEVYAVRQQCVGPHTCADCSFRNSASYMVLEYAKSLNLSVRGIYPSELVDAIVDKVMERLRSGFTVALFP